MDKKISAESSIECRHDFSYVLYSEVEINDMKEQTQCSMEYDYFAIQTKNNSMK